MTNYLNLLQTILFLGFNLEFSYLFILPLTIICFGFKLLYSLIGHWNEKD